MVIREMHDFLVKYETLDNVILSSEGSQVWSQMSSHHSSHFQDLIKKMVKSSILYSSPYME